MKLQVKIHNENGLTRVVDVPTGKKITTFITPEEGKFNFELVDLETGLAPNGIVAKRQGNDLAITFEDADQADLILEGYYNNDDPALIIGLAEDGNYYAYVPETGVSGDAIPNLPEAVLASEVLGGNPVALTPFVFANWAAVGLGLLAAAATAAAIYKMTRDHDNPIRAEQSTVTANTDGSVAVNVPNNAKAGETVAVAVTNPNGTTQTVDLTKQPDGSWTSSNPEIVPDIPTGSNTAIIPNDQVKDGSTVTATDGKGTTDSAVAANPIPDAPTISEPNDETGDVTIGLPTNNVEPGDQVVVEYTKPNGEKAQVTLTYGEDGKWTSDNPAIVVGEDENGNPTATIPNSEIKDGSEITAVAKDATTGVVGNPTSGTAGNPVPNAPTISDRDDETGEVVIGLPTENLEPGDQVVVDYTKPNGEKGQTTLTYGEDGKWTSDNPAVVIGEDENGNPTATLPNNEVKDGSDVTATVKDGVSGKESEPTTGVAGDPLPNAPTIVPQQNGDVWLIDLPEDAEPGDVVVIKYTDPDGNEIEVTLTKQPDGSWKAEPDVVNFDENGNVVIPTSQVKDGSPVEAASYNEADTDKTNPNKSEPANSTDVAPDAPVVKDPDNTSGDVVVELPTNNVEPGDKVTIKYQAPNGEEKEVVLEKVPVSEENPTGWKIVEPVGNPDGVQLSLDENGNPIATIPGDKVKDGSEVTAIAEDATHQGEDAPKDQGTAGDPDPSAPEITPTTDGGVSIKLPEDAEPGDVVKVIYTDKNGDTVVTTVVKDKDGTWKDEDPNTTIDGDTLTIPGDKIKDGTDVTAISVNADKADIPTTDDGSSYIAPEPEKNPENLEEIKNQGNSDTKTTEDPLPDSPTVVPNADGSVTIINLPENAETGDKVVIEYFKPTDGDEPTGKAVLTKQEDGTWAADPNNPDVVVGTDADGNPIATIDNDKVKDGTEVKAYSTNAADDSNENGSEPSTGTTEDLPPEAPKVDADEKTGDVVITLPVENVQPGDKVTVSYTDPEGNKQSVELTKTEDGWEVTGGTDAGKEALTLDKDGDGVPDTDANGNPIATLPGDKVKDGSVVTAIAEDAKTQGEDAPKDTTQAPDREPEAPTVERDPESKEVHPDVIITLPTEGVEVGDYVEVGYIDKDGQGWIATIEKTPEGWVSNDPNVVVAEDGKTATIDGDLLLPGSEVVAVTINNSSETTDPASEDKKEATEQEIQGLKDKGNSDSDQTENDPPPSQPTLAAQENGDMAIGLPTDAEAGDKVDVEFTKPDGTKETVTLEKQPDGTWTSSNPDLIPSTTADKPNEATLPNANVDDASDVTATAYDDNTPKADVTGTTEKAADPAPAQPSVEAKPNGDVEVTMPTENVEPGDKVDVEFTKPDGTKESVTYEAQPDGTWKAMPEAAATENGLPTTLPEAGVLTLPNELVDDNSDVTATAYDDNNPKADVTEPGSATAADPAPAQPSVEAKPNGDVEVTMPTENVEPGDKVDVEFTKPDGTKESVTYEAQPDGTWKAMPEADATENGLPTTLPEEGVLTLPNELVDDNSDVTATAYDDNNPKADVTEPGSATAADPAPAQPSVEAKPNGDVEVTMPTENVEPGDKVDVEFTKPDGTKESVTYEAQPDGTWKAMPEADATENGLPTTLPEEGVLTLPNELVDDNSDVTATAYDDNNPKADVTEPGSATAADPAPAQPSVEAKPNGDVEVTMPTENVEPGDKVDVEFTKPDGTKESVTYEAQPDGTWKAMPEADATENGLPTTLPEEGVLTLPNELVDDNSDVTATAYDDNNPKADVTEPGSATAADPAPAQPSVEAKPNGDVEVTMPTENVEPGDKVDVEFTKPDGTKESVTYEAQPDGTWKAMPEADATENGLPTTLPEEGVLTLPNELVDDNSDVTATAYDDNNPKADVTEPGSATAADPAPAQPSVEAKPNGDVEVTMPTENVEPGDKVDVEFTKPDGTKESVTYEAQPDGTWKAMPEADATENGLPTTLPEEGVLTLPNELVDDNSDVTATAYDDNNPKADVTEPGSATAADPAPAQPSVEAKPNGDVEVTMPTENVEPGDKVDVEFTKPDGTKESVTYEAQPDGTWKAMPEADATENGLPTTLPEEGVLTLPNELVDDNSDVTATAYDDNNPKADVTEPGSATAADPAPAQPSVEAKPNGDVEVTMPTENVEPGDEVEITFTKPGEEQTTTVTYVAQPDGTWKAEPETDATENGLPTTIDEAGTVTLPNELTKDNSDVSAVAKDETNTMPETNEQNSATTADTPVSQPTFGEEADPENPTGDVVINLPTDAEAGDKVDVSFTKPGETTPTEVTLTKQPDGTWAADPADSGIVLDGDTATLPNDIVKDGSEVTAVAYDDAQAEPTATPITTEAGDPKPSGLDVKFDENGNVVVDLPTENVEAGDKVVVIITDPEGNETPITFEKTPDGWTVEPADKGIVIDGDTATIPAAEVPNNSDVKGDTFNGEETTPVEEKVVDNKVQTEKPTVTDVFAIDTSNPADEKPELLKVTGKTADPFSEVEIVYQGDVIGTGTSDKDGNFEITATPKADKPLTLGDEVEVYATDVVNDKLKSDKADGLDVLDEQGNPTGEKQPVSVPEVVEGAEGHIGDRTAPKQPTLDQGSEPGSVLLTFPTEDINGNPIQDGDVVEVNFEDEDGNKQVVLFTKTPEGWQSDKPELVPGDGGNGLVTEPNVLIKPDMLQDGSTVAAQTRDIAGNESPWEYETAGSDTPQIHSPDPTVESVVAYDTSEQADRDPEYVYISGSVTYPAGTPDAGEVVKNGKVTVTFPDFKDAEGNPVKIEVNTDENGKFELIVKESDDTPLKDEHSALPALSLNNEHNLVAFTEFELFSEDTERGYLPSYQPETGEGYPIVAEVLPVLDGADYHIGDKSLPTQPTLTPAQSDDPTNPDGGMLVGLPLDANPGDKVILEFTDENNQPQKVTLTKQDDGSWKSDNSLLVPDVAPRTDEAKIPEDTLLDGSEVTAYSQDLADNVDKDSNGDIVKVSASAGSDEADPEKTAIPTYSVIEAFDTAGDSKPEAISIEGKSEPNAKVEVFKDGVKVGETTANEDGDFTLNIDNAAGSLNILDKLEMKATAPNKLESDPADVQVPRIVPATAPLITPNEGGSVVILPQGNDTKVTIKYFDEKNEPKETVIEKDPDTGLWSISGSNTLTETDDDGVEHTTHDPRAIDFDPVTGGVTIYEPSLQDVVGSGDATTVTAIGSNGNKAAYDRTTTAQVKSVSALEFSDVYAKDTSEAANDDPEEIYFTIKTQEVTSVDHFTTKVEIISPNGEVYEVQNIVEDKNLDGTVKITIKEETNPGLDLQVGSLVRVTQTTADRDPTTKFFSVPELQQGEQWHSDVTPPEAPVITPDGNGGATIALPKENTHPGDKVVVSIVPEGQTEPVEVTLEKTPNGWISDNPALVPSTVGQADPDSVFIPHRNIADNSELGAKAVGTEGKETPAVPAQIGGFTADIDPATIAGEIINQDTPDQAVKAVIKLDAMVDNDPDDHNAKTLTVELPLIKANGEKVTATVTFNVSDTSHKDGEQFFQLENGGIISSGIGDGVKQFWEVSSAQEFTLTDGSTAKLDPNGIINAITTNDEGSKEVSYDLANLGYTDYVPPQTNAPTLLGKPNEAAGLVKEGEVKITPDADNDAMQITYPIEHGNGTTATVLAQKGDDGKWKLFGNAVNSTNQNGEPLVTIDENTGVVTLHPDAVADNQEVTAIGLKDGKEPSEPAKVVAGEEPQSIGEWWGTVNDLLPFSPTVGQYDNLDVGVWRRSSSLQGAQNSALGGTTYGRSDALVNLINQLRAQNDLDANYETWSGGTGTSGDRSRVNYTLNTNDEDNIARIYNSLGNMNSNHINHTGYMTLNTGAGNDAIVIGRDLGFSGTTPEGDRYMRVNTGEGNDILVVGATNDWFKVVQYYDFNPATGRYDIPGIVDIIDYDAPLPANARYLPNLDLYNDVSGVKRTGGHLANADVTMGNGDDAIVISGVDSVSAAAISHSRIDLGDGHNRLIIAPNGVGNSLEIRGSIAEGSNIIGGKDSDYIQAPLITKTAKVSLGAGSDEVKATKIAGDAQISMGDGDDKVTVTHLIEKAVVDMGNGNDVVTVTDSFNNSATVNLGAGDDRFNWGFRTSGGGLVEGGEGYDVISLQGYGASDSSPVGWRASSAVSNIKTADFNDVEEIIMNGNNALDIKFTDMRDSKTYEFKLDDGSTKKAKFIVSANKEGDSVVDSNIASNKVDFGQTDWNRDSDLDLRDTSTGSGARWADVGDVVIGGKTYDVYRHTSAGASHDFDVLVQQGITII